MWDKFLKFIPHLSSCFIEQLAFYEDKHRSSTVWLSTSVNSVLRKPIILSPSNNIFISAFIKNEQ